MRTFILLTCLIPSVVNASFFMEEDKQKHIIATTSISLAVTSALIPSQGKFKACLAGLGSALAIGAIKEATDPVFDMRDMAANTIGGSLGCTISIQF